MNRYDNLLRGIASFVVAVGLLGVTGALLGGQKHLATSQILVASCVIGALWGVILLFYTQLMTGVEDSRLARPVAAKSFNSLVLVEQVILAIVGAIAIHRATSWLYISFATVLVNEILIIFWIYVAIRRWKAKRAS